VLTGTRGTRLGEHVRCEGNEGGRLRRPNANCEPNQRDLAVDGSTSRSMKRAKWPLRLHALEGGFTVLCPFQGGYGGGVQL
jgi:hypothetical protein